MGWDGKGWDGKESKFDAMKNATRATASKHVRPHGQHSKNTRLLGWQASGRGFQRLKPHAADPGEDQGLNWQASRLTGWQIGRHASRLAGWQAARARLPRSKDPRV